MNLLPCPFCGGEAFQHQVGSESSKKRGFDVGCQKCRVTISDRVKVLSMDWCKQANAENWNKRSCTPP